MALIAVLAAAILVFGGDRRVLFILGGGAALGIAYLVFPRPVERGLGAIESWILKVEALLLVSAALAALVVTALAFM